MDRLLPVQDHHVAVHGRDGMSSVLNVAAIVFRPVDYVLIAVIAAVVVGAVVLAARRKKNGSSCCGDCAKCRNRCPS